MDIGIPRETKEGERRVALLPAAVRALVGAGHAVVVERGAGAGIDASDADYAAAGASLADAHAAWRATLVVKVKEIQDQDLVHLPSKANLFSFHHLPGEPQRTRELAQRAATAIAFEMVRDDSGSFPLLAPMSAIAGRMAIGIGNALLGHAARRVLVLGAGHAGLAAAGAAARAGCAVTVLTRSARSRDAAMALGVAAELAGEAAIERHALQADLVVGAVFLAAQPTPKLLPRALVRRMKPGAVIVDVSIDAGGVAETSRATTHGNPTFVDEGVIHYCVANIPAAAPAEAAAALSEALLPRVAALAEHGVGGALRRDPGLREGVLLWKGAVTHAGIAAEAGLPYTPLRDSDLS